jgi:DegV family protein with EDD domain
MSYKIVIDSCGELPKELKKDPRFESIPLRLEVGEYQIEDDENFNQAEFLEIVAKTPTCPKSSCPSPERYMDAYYSDAQDIYVVTLSGKLSGSHNSAVLGKSLYHDKYGEKNICIIDSCSASCGETQIALKAMELAEKGLPFPEIEERLLKFRDELTTYFVLDNLETLRKNGRLTGVKALVASTLSIKPVMGATDEGSIHQLGQAIGIKKAITKMADLIVKEVVNPEEKVLMISHCNCLERAKSLQDLVCSKVTFKGVSILDTAGISSMYANDGGVIVVV